MDHRFLFASVAAGALLGALSRIGEDGAYLSPHICFVSPVLTERRHSGGFIVMEGGRDGGMLSRDQVTIAQQSAGFQGAVSPILPAGLVLGRQAPTTGAYTADPTNTGNGTCGAIAVGAAAKVGDYRINFTAATAFTVYDPNGNEVGTGATGSAFSAGGLGFTITAGGTAFVAGDGATIAVTESAGAAPLYEPLNLEATDGSEIAVAILFNETDASQGNTKVTVISRQCEVNGSELIYPLNATALQIAAINGQLAAQGIIVR